MADAFTLEERVTLAEAAIRMMGLDRFAPLIVLAGHGSTSANNLYQSALDCGACGGNPGAVNARAAAGIFNDPAVRTALRARGIDIPIDTVFVAAVHDTVADTVTILDPHLIPPTHTATVDAFRELAGTRRSYSSENAQPTSPVRTPSSPCRDCVPARTTGQRSTPNSGSLATPP